MNNLMLKLVFVGVVVAMTGCKKAETQAPSQPIAGQQAKPGDKDALLREYLNNNNYKPKFEKKSDF